MITPEQRELRSRYVGSSDMPVLCGVNVDAKGEQYANIADLWAEKTGKVEPKDESAKARKGRFFERAILDMFDYENGVTTERNVPMLVKGDICANLDAAKMAPNPQGRMNGVDGTVYLGRDIEFGAEAKFTGFRELWGEDVTDLPMSVLVQCNTQMLCGGHSLTHVPVMWPVYRDFSFKTYHVERDDELIEQLQERAAWFMKFVKADIPPPNVSPHYETIKRIKRTVDVEPIDLPKEVGSVWKLLQRVRAEKKVLDLEDEWYVSALAQQLTVRDEAASKTLFVEAGRLPDGRLLNYFSQNGQRSTDISSLSLQLLGAQALIKRAIETGDTAALRDINLPNVLESCVSQSAHRVLRMNEPPKPKASRRRG